MIRHALLATGVSAALIGLPALAVAAPPAVPGGQGLASADVAVRDASNSLAANSGALKAGAADRFQATGSTVDANGTRHVRFDRTYQGLKVLGGDVVVHNAPNGQFKEATVGLAAPLNLSVTPAVTPQRAAALAVGGFAGQPGSSAPELVVDATAGEPALSWKVTVNGKAADGGASQMNVVIDAQSGLIRNQWDSVRTFAARGTRSAGTAATNVVTASATGNGKGYHVGDVTLGVNSTGSGYELKDPSRGNGETRDALNNGDANGNTDPTVATSAAFTSTTGTFGDNTLTNRATVAVDAHYGIQWTWDYFKNVHGRNGIKGDGVGAKSYVHYYVDYDNAGWSDSCFCMIYGDGAPGSKPFTQLDVAGHEMAHGVTGATARLVYSAESGGLNEATSDIFGTLVEFYANTAADAPDYLIGEKIDIRGNGTPLRWMDDPTKDGKSHGCWSSTTKNVDVHYSSGVGNKFFYQLAVGSGSSSWGNSPVCAGAPAVTGIGNDKAGKIWYKALTTYFTSTETYGKARISTIKAANDLYGATECNAVKAAWKAVSVAAQTGEPACATAPSGAPVVTNPGSKTGTVGTAVSLQVSATDPQGDAVTFSATGLPAGLSISASGLVTGTPATAGTYNVTVTAKDPGNLAGTATFTWTISAVSGGCTAAQLIGNGGFESGTTPWTASSGVITNSASQAARTGSYKAWLDGYGSAHTDTLSQTVSIPAGCTTATFSFYLHIDTKETGSTVYDRLTVQAGTTTLATYSNVNAASGYVLKTFSLANFAGQTVTLKFTGVEDSSLATSFVIDDVSLNVG
ncbi:M4 family metallopeptidase [Longispora albida]|uniref:M4 family metallopeptidase n=1 Tax=Longispora albida TaxID=203523 RepID=UPI0003694E83|nr:M4 family metallopeptidase [Longispora albida]